MLTDDARTTPATTMIMGTSLLIDGRLQRGSVTVVDGVVTEVLAADHSNGIDGSAVRAHAPDHATVIDLGDQPLCPAPIDIHFHGAGGVSVPPFGEPHALDAAIGELLAATTWSRDVITGDALPADAQPYRYLATLPVPGDQPGTVVEQLADAARAYARSRTSRCAGLRLEGLFLNTEKAGVWPPEAFRLPDIGLCDELIDACDEAGTPLRIIDVAPELPGAIELIEHAVSRGVVVSVAHTNATFDEAHRAFDAGARLATHLFNAMRPIHHREPGVVTAALIDDRVRCELIIDGHHVHPAVIELAARTAGPERLVAISDASPCAGLPDGTREWNGMQISVFNGMLHDSQGRLAGAARLLDAAGDTLRAGSLSMAQSLVAIAATPHAVLDGRSTLGIQPGDALWCPGTCVTQRAG